MTEQIESLVADLLGIWDSGSFEREDVQTAVNELRRLHEVNAELLKALEYIAGQSMSMYGSHAYMIEGLQETASAAITKAEATK